MIIAGTREKTSKKIMQRFKQLFDNIPQFIKSSTDLITELTNGTTIEALPSNSEAIRDDAKINCVFIDETAFFNRVDDSIVMDAVRPIIMTNKSDFFVISTPNGPCYSGDTDVMTYDGWKNIKDLSYDDKLACLIDDNIQYHNPQFLQSFENQKFLHFESTQTDLMVTPEHKLWVKIQKGKWKKKEVEYFIDKKQKSILKKISRGKMNRRLPL